MPFGVSRYHRQRARVIFKFTQLLLFAIKEAIIYLIRSLNPKGVTTLELSKRSRIAQQLANTVFERFHRTQVAQEIKALEKRRAEAGFRITLQKIEEIYRDYQEKVQLGPKSETSQITESDSSSEFGAVPKPKIQDVTYQLPFL